MVLSNGMLTFCNIDKLKTTEKELNKYDKINKNRLVISKCYNFETNDF